MAEAGKPYKKLIGRLAAPTQSNWLRHRSVLAFGLANCILVLDFSGSEIRRLPNMLFIAKHAFKCLLSLSRFFKNRQGPLGTTFVAACSLLVYCPIVVGQSEETRLNDLFARAWEFRLRQDPLEATNVGDHRFNDLLPTVSLETIEAQSSQKQKFLDELLEIDRSTLSPVSQMNYDVFRLTLEYDLADARFRSYLIPITNREGFHVSFPNLRQRVPLKTVKDFENYIARLTQFDQYAAGHIELMEAGIREGYTLPSVVLEGFAAAIEPHMVADPVTSLMYDPFRKMPDSISSDDRARLRAAAAAAIQQGVVAGYRRFLKFMQDRYIPSARGSIAASALPDGREYYRHCVRKYTTLDLLPEQVHATGMSEVQRIRDEMQSIIKKLQFDGDLPAFTSSLRANERFHPESAQHLMKEVSYVLKQIDGRLPQLFKTLPRTPYGLKPIPDYIAPKTTTAYYMPPPGDGSIAGLYYINTYDLKSRPLYEIEALSLHEAVPGHHLQIALQQELADVPNFRRFQSFTAFVEGWALYSERLGLEMGFYQDPYSDFGRLTYEMWRACRLVVDTGIHYLGWTRQQAIDFMAENTALSLHNIRAEVDRYIAWPGQAVAYKIGELKIRELRAFAERELGEQFDVREFHDVVLLQGSLPLSVLESNVKGWVSSRKR
jgi:uncharacterized protein (DUF885 family)